MPKVIPAQLGPKGDLVFWMPYKKGYVHMEYNTAMAEMRSRYARGIHRPTPKAPKGTSVSK